MLHVKIITNIDFVHLIFLPNHTYIIKRQYVSNCRKNILLYITVQCIRIHPFNHPFYQSALRLAVVQNNPPYALRRLIYKFQLFSLILYGGPDA